MDQQLTDSVLRSLTLSGKTKASALQPQQQQQQGTSDQTNFWQIMSSPVSDGGRLHQNEAAQPPMSCADFRLHGKVMIDYIADYLEGLSERRVTPTVQPGYLRPRLPASPPTEPQPWADIMSDVDKHIMEGMTHWQHPDFHAYFGTGNSFPSIMADMLANAMGCLGFSWAASPACTELETIVVDWLGKMVGLPEKFLPFTENGTGGGVFQGSGSECTLVSLLAARNSALQELAEKEESSKAHQLPRLRAYCSSEAHSSVEKAAMIGLVEIRSVPTDDKFSLDVQALQRMIEEDRAAGFVPFFVVATVGTTGCCAFDSLADIGPVCQRENIWLHVDAAYAGNALICPEFRYLIKGIEYAASFGMSPNKWLLVNFDCSALWVAERSKLIEALTVDPLYLKHDNEDKSIDYRHWSIPLSRHFRSLKLWLVIRSYGVSGLQRNIREYCRLAKLFAETLQQDRRFQVMNNVTLGLVCFRLRQDNRTNEKLLAAINDSGRLHMVPSMMKKDYVIRFCICSPNVRDDDIVYATDVISSIATDVEHENDLGLDGELCLDTEPEHEDGPSR